MGRPTPQVDLFTVQGRRADGKVRQEFDPHTERLTAAQPLAVSRHDDVCWCRPRSRPEARRRVLHLRHRRLRLGERAGTSKALPRAVDPE